MVRNPRCSNGTHCDIRFMVPSSRQVLEAKVLTCYAPAQKDGQQRMLDLHCHILPEIDDGPENLDGALALARELVRLGFTGVCATPHNPWGSSSWTAADLHQRREVLSSHLAHQGIPLALFSGAENHSSAAPDLLSQGKLVCYPRGDTFLLEFPLGGFPPRWDDLLFRFRVKGLVPVIAHVERYPEVQKNSKVLEIMRENGCFLLVNLSSLVAPWSRAAQVTARALLKGGLVDAATTDLHVALEGNVMAEGVEALSNLVGADGVQRLLRTGPLRIAGLLDEGGGT